MKELKFRAWDNKKLCWFVPMYEAYKGHLAELCLNLNGALALRTMSGFYGTHPDEGAGQPLNERYTIYQWTGLKDRNGNEIFIGHILLLDLIKGDRFSEVKICETREIPVVRFFEEDGWEPLHCYVGKPDTCLQVVGDIHQNPELLEKP